MGFSTKDYLTAKLDRYRQAGIATVMLCVDRASAPDCDLHAQGAQICSFTRSVDADDLLAMLPAGP